MNSKSVFRIADDTMEHSVLVFQWAVRENHEKTGAEN
jgi:hypothetical protein